MIGTLNEKSIHSMLKDYYESDKTKQEVPIGGYVADIVNSSGIIEIQSRGFDKLREKLKYYTINNNVKVVYPVSILKYINWVDPITREVVERRKSPGKLSVIDVFEELYKIRELLTNANITFTVVLLETEEYKLLDGHGINNKNKATKVDKVPTNIIEEISFSIISGYEKFVPRTLKRGFTSDDYAKAARCKIKTARTALLILTELGYVTRTGKEGRKYLYRSIDK